MKTWLQPPLQSTRRLLFACVILEFFDADAVEAVVQDHGLVAQSFAAIASMSWVQPVDPPLLGKFRLHASVSTELLSSLRQEFREEYLLYRERAFGYWARQLCLATKEVAQRIEPLLMGQLDALFLLLADSNELEQLAHLLERARQLPLHDKIHHDSLCFYQAGLARDSNYYPAAQQIYLKLRADPLLDPLLRARVLNGLGILYDIIGRYDQAIGAYEESAEQYQQLGELAGEAKARKNQGIVYHELAQYEKARSRFERCLALAQQMGDSVLEMRALLELGYTSKELGQWQAAWHFYKGAMAIAQACSEREWIARLHNNLGELYCLGGDWQEAENNYSAALLLIQDRRDIADIQHNLGFLYFVQHSFDQALRHYRQGIKIAEQIEDYDAVSKLYYRIGCLYEYRGQYKAAHNAYKKAIETIEKLRLRAEQEETRISVLGIRQHIYQAMVALCLKQNDNQAALDYVEYAKSRTFLDRWGKALSPNEQHVEEPLTASEIKKRLPNDTVLVEFFAIGQLGPNQQMLAHLPTATQHLRDYFAPPEQLLAFIVTKQTIHVVPLALQLTQLEAQYFYAGNNRLRGVQPTAKLQPLTRWHQLDAQLLAPLRPYWQGKRHLVFVPHGAIHYLPLHALSADGNLLYGSDTSDCHITVSYAPSASIWLKICLDDSKRLQPTLACLAIGVDGDGLKQAEAEAQSIAKQLGGEALTGSNATRKNVLARFCGANVGHFACHGEFRQSNPMYSALLLADGELTATDILKHPQLRARLITLSACDTGLNHLTHGDELMGLTRAFLVRGARSLVVSLWQVNDTVTRILMERFYLVWQQSNSAAFALGEAVRYLRSLDVDGLRGHLVAYCISPEAVQETIEGYTNALAGPHPLNHPYYWGAFLLIGNPN